MDRVHRIFLAAILAAFFTACRKPAPAESERHYALTGRIVALNTRDRIATVDAAAIPSFMEAMTMEYPIESKDQFAQLHVGEKITATLRVRDDGLYSLSNIRPQRSPAK